MKITFILPDMRMGGVERVRLILANEFVKMGHEVEFALMQLEGELLLEAQATFNVVDLGVKRARGLPFAVSRYLKLNKPDALVVAMWPLTTLAVLGRILSGIKCRLLISEHGIISGEYSTWGWLHMVMLRVSMVLGYRCANARVGVSLGVINDMSKLSLLRINKFSVINNPILAEKTVHDGPALAIDALWGVKKGARILAVSRFKRVKNISLLIHSLAKLSSVPNARLMLLGSGEEELALRALAKKLGVSSKVIFPGFQNDPSLFYSTADLFVLSSNYEGFGNVIVEALAHGLPVVSTNCPSGPAEILGNGRWGRLVPVGDADAFALAIKEALLAPTDCDALRKRAADFAPDIAARKYLELLLRRY